MNDYDASTVAVPAFTTTFDGINSAQEAFSANIGEALKGIQAALSGKPRARDTLAATHLRKLIECMRVAGL